MDPSTRRPISRLVAVMCQVSSLQPPHHDTQSTPGAMWHVRHISCSCRSALVGVCGGGKTRLTTFVSIRHAHRFVSSASRQSGASITSQRACVLLIVWYYRPFSSCCGSRLAVPRKNLGDPQPHGEQLPHLSRAMTSPLLQCILGFSNSTSLCLLSS